MKRVKSGGGWPAIFYTFRKGRQAGGLWNLWKALRSKNACKTCALGMGGQKGGMTNEHGSFPEICKKGIQAMVSDLQGAVPLKYFDTYSTSQMQQFTPRELETSGRITHPMLREKGSQYYRPISWEEAFQKIVSKLKLTPPNETFWYFSGRSSNEAAFLLQLFARIYGTNNVNNCSYYCHQASGVGLNNVFGTGTATVVLEDVEHADLLFLIGGNPASNHPRLMSSLKQMRRKGGKIIVINPLIETGLVNFRVPSDPWSLLFGTRIATRYLQPHIGGDQALLIAIAKRIVEMNAHDSAFMLAHTEHWDQYKADLEAITWEELIASAGITKAEIDLVAQEYAAAKNVVFCWTMGITHHTHGVENVEAIAQLALLRGMVGRPRAGMLPIRGHSNVQGIGSVGVTPKLKDAIFERLQNHFQVKLPTSPGLDTMACMDAADKGEVKVGVCLGGNLYGSNPDATFAGKAMSKLELVVYLNTTLNTGHAHGLGQETIILPVLARDEEPEPTTQESMFNYIRLSDGGPSRLTGPLSEIEVISTIADRVLTSTGPINWKALQHTRNIRTALAAIIPGYESIKEIDRTKQEFQIPGRTFHTPEFNTPSRKAVLQFHKPAPYYCAGDLKLMTIRSEGQFNTVVYEDYDLYRGVDQRDVILLHPEDIARLKLTKGQRVTVKSEVGAMSKILVWEHPEMRPGCAAMYCPEANILVPKKLDPRSKTPAFKAIDVWIEA
jgi:molybdopterin-dependent oxidoreductase alpha subunit